MHFEKSVYAEPWISFPDSATAEIAIFRSDDPLQYAHHTLKLIPPGSNLPIPSSNRVTFRYEGEAFTTICDGASRNFGSASASEIQNQISCTVDRSNPLVPASQVYVSLTIFNQNVYRYSYSDRPDLQIDPHLKATSAESPFCVSDELIASASFCKWERQNLNDPLLMGKAVPLNAWLVYGRSSVTSLPLSYTIPIDEDYPFNEGDQVCAADLNHDGLVATSEMTTCIEADEGFLCPFQKTDCVDDACPLGSGYPCLIHNGISECSPYACHEFHEATSVTQATPRRGQPINWMTAPLMQAATASGRFISFPVKTNAAGRTGLRPDILTAVAVTMSGLTWVASPLILFCHPIVLLSQAGYLTAKGKKKS